MSPADAVLSDALREAGFERLTPWHLRCVEAYLAQLAGAHRLDDRAAALHDRVRWDLNNTLDELHSKALREDAWMREQRLEIHEGRLLRLRDGAHRSALDLLPMGGPP